MTSVPVKHDSKTESLVSSLIVAGYPLHFLWVREYLCTVSLCQCKASGVLFTCIALWCGNFLSNTCVFSLCLENIHRRMVNLLAEDIF